jgi:hypothetical protein
MIAFKRRGFSLEPCGEPLLPGLGIQKTLAALFQWRRKLG